MGMTKWFCCDFWQTGKREKRQLSVDIREERTNKSLSSATFAAKWVLLESEKNPPFFPIFDWIANIVFSFHLGNTRAVASFFWHWDISPICRHSVTCMFYLLGYSSSAAAISCDEDDDKNDDVAERRRDEKLAQLSPLISPHFGGIYQIRIREKRQLAFSFFSFALPNYLTFLRHIFQAVALSQWVKVGTFYTLANFFFSSRESGKKSFVGP